MFKKPIALLLINALLLAFTNAPAVFASTNKEVQRAVQVKANLAQLGTGRAAQVQLKLRDHRKLAGFIASMEADTFTLTDAATSTDVTLRYTEVTQIKGRNSSTGKKVAIGAAIGIGVAILVAVIAIGSWPDGR
ncbi:MAG: hypothetical protein ABI977_32815 [Acidobacteriota bacterium]